MKKIFLLTLIFTGLIVFSAKSQSNKGTPTLSNTSKADTLKAVQNKENPAVLEPSSQSKQTGANKNKAILDNKAVLKISDKKATVHPQLNSTSSKNNNTKVK